ncbi:hypothetical protein K443DRAFT_681613 [Laccaria amethystina LaAM-08-1]|uniref:Uncharacterized protein n=1 Tax=Laccaria amethystina LaAM-08-1 TaxID=1095629 RepID=A0A0C9XI91_9AGAR|nr:hypothetical protein K443DRAFT_681613 [Laccaria amethystina LaAM-08-1]
MALTSDSQPPPSRSRTSSISTFSFPRTSSPTKDPTFIAIPKPSSNAHPYAIKTTSTGVLSRSSSSPHHQAHSTTLTQHHYVPSTPSPSGQASPTKYKPPRENRHRYSRSLTSEEPRSLPVPPSRSPSPSPPSGNGGEDEEDDTPRMRQRTKRADTLPSSTIPTLELPEDPKTWSPTHLSTYLSSTLRGAGAGEIPDQVTRDITAFVKEKQITGKTFLRLNEGDLERSELPKTHHPILLSASRSLRQNILQGRIWGFESSHSFPLNSPQNDDFSSNSPNVDVGRSRNVSFDSTSNGNGRVKGMIASLERSSSSEDDDDDQEKGGRRSNSPNKNQRHPTAYSPSKEQQHSASYSHSPNKTQRALPSRGTVHDLFSFSAPSPGTGFSASAPSPGAGRGANTKEGSDTRTEGEETIKSPHQARLLPYPPLLTPVHTGSGSRSPFISTGSPFAPASISMDAAGLYELGYRYAPLPLSSLPTGSSGPVPPPFGAIPIPLGVGGPGQQHARPLPLPPHNGQQLLVDPPVSGVGGERKREGVATTVTDSGSVIHHPRPRPGVGVGLVGFYDVPRDTSGDDVPPPSDDGAGPDTQTEPETETEGGYDTAPSQLSEDGGDEPSMVDLLLSHSPAHPISGAEAWELELGETVKRVGAGVGGSTNGIGGSGVVRTGRGRRVRAKVGGVGEGGKSIKEKDEHEEKGKGKAEGRGKENAEERVEGKGKAQEGTKGEEEEPNVREMEDAGDERKPDLWSVFDLDPPRGGQRASKLGSGDVDDRSALDLDPHFSLDSHSDTTEQVISNSTEHDLTTLRATLTTRQEALDQRELGLAARQERIEGMDERVREVQRAVGYREEAVGRREKEVEEREKAVERREEKVAGLEQALDEQERALDQRGSELEERSKRVEEEKEMRSVQLGGLNASTSALGSNSWPITLLRSVVFRVLGDKTSSFLFCSGPPSSSDPSPSSNPTSSTTTPSSASTPPQRRPRRDWEARRDLYLSTGGRGSYLVLVGIGVCAVVLKVLVRRLTGVGMWSWLGRRSRR